MSSIEDARKPLLDGQKRQDGDYQATQQEPSAGSKAQVEMETVENVWIIMTGLWVGVFLAALDSSIVSTIYAKIGSEFHASNQVSWIVTSYLLSFTALQPLYSLNWYFSALGIYLSQIHLPPVMSDGRLSDIFGRKSTLLFATSMFFIGSAACGAATDIWSLVIARAIAGLGGGGLNTMSTVVMSDVVSMRQRGKFQGIGNLAWAVCMSTTDSRKTPSASLIGAPLGGWIADYFSWRYCFYINLPLLVICFFITTTQITNYNTKSTTQSLSTKLKRIDYFGSGSLVLSVTGLLLGTSWGGNTMSWDSPVVIACLVGGLGMLVAFAVIEAKVASEPILPWRVFSARAPFVVSMTNFFGSINSYAMIFFVPLDLTNSVPFLLSPWHTQAVYGTSASQAGLAFVPQVVGAAIGSLSAGLLMTRTGTYRGLTWVVFFLTIVGSCGLKTWNLERGPNWQYSAPLVIVGFGFGSGLTTTLIAMLASVEPKGSNHFDSQDLLIRFGRYCSGCVNVILVPVDWRRIGYIDMLRYFPISFEIRADCKHPWSECGIGEYKPSTAHSFDFDELISLFHITKIIDTARKSVDAIRTLPPEYKDIVVTAYFHAIQWTFSINIVFAVLTFVASLFLPKVKLSTTVQANRD
ncbi:major facilitator superfamily domain-containing protein [Jimgerdemannia flammicorona]|uniref:Major facilitator superfamily domain-containing protein n=1 Tax=Jimgerdemannia flammicorona TaxID=994334 RepID=A0A433D765_9FUNG|nr:major facilitator superfamily domain-containing protein [Jimgerdemannia flammicorona]